MHKIFALRALSPPVRVLQVTNADSVPRPGMYVMDLKFQYTSFQYTSPGVRDRAGFRNVAEGGRKPDRGCARHGQSKAREGGGADGRRRRPVTGYGEHWCKRIFINQSCFYKEKDVITIENPKIFACGELRMGESVSYCLFCGYQIGTRFGHS